MRPLADFRFPASDARAGLERLIQRLEQPHALLEQCRIIGKRCTKSFHQRTYCSRMRILESGVLQIEVVHDLTDPPERRSVQGKALTQHLERAPITLVLETA